LPRRDDIKKILIIGSGPIVIGQACEFDYSGTQACKALKQEGYELVLVNSNPATIMTDPEFADRTYIEPITPEMVEKIIAIERPDVLLPTVGGQTALNTSVELAESGVLEKYGVELIGAKLEAIKKAEDRQLFKNAMHKIGLRVPASDYVKDLHQAQTFVERVGFPVIIRPSFTLGGTGGNVAYNQEELQRNIRWALDLSPVDEVLVEESIIGWKEFELEVMRDLKDNVVIICSIENFDPMGVHTGDSITVAPAQTLTDKEYQVMRDASLRIIREIGVETGGSNIQFGVNPEDGSMVVIEMNPRVSRSSALASKATGFPIAKIAAKLAVGYTLDEIQNDITRETPACFEPTIDYCVVKFPRFAFEKFAATDPTLTTQMKSVGEVMAIGRTFKESLMKAIRSLEIGRYGLETRCFASGINKEKIPEIIEKLTIPNWERIWYIFDAYRVGISTEEIFRATKIDPWFLDNIRQIMEKEKEIKEGGELSGDRLREAKMFGLSDRYLANILSITEGEIRSRRKEEGLQPVYKMVDTCAAEFQAYTPYLYSTYESECEANPTDRKKIVILGGGPNRIGQGIEFDYCCVHASFALAEDGYETIMVNCNPETVSTDYDTSDRLYFDPLTVEDILHIIETEKPVGVIVQFGGQTPLKLALALEEAGVPIIGTKPSDIDRAEDRKKFQQLIQKLGILQPDNATATSVEEAVEAANSIGYPVLVRPSYVLGGRAMEIVYDRESLLEYMRKAIDVSPDHPVLVDKFLEDAVEMDVDAVSDGEQVVVAGLMEHIEEAGIHSGDSACSLPPYSMSPEIIDEVRSQTKILAKELNVVGLINIQFAIQDGKIYILEVNPRASRTVPFVSKAIGVPLAKIAASVMAGKKLSELGFTEERQINHMCVKEAVFPFTKFPGVDTLLSPEMRSTGEVMGIADDFGGAFAKAQIAAGVQIPFEKGNAFISVRDGDKPAIVEIARELINLGFKVIATEGTHRAISAQGLPAELVVKVSEGRPNIVDIIKDGRVDMVINTTEGKMAKMDSYHLRRAALIYDIPYFTTVSGSRAAVAAIKSLRAEKTKVKSIQEYHGL
jgi:carbamoyl-phosphate synthase large subunit